MFIGLQKVRDRGACGHTTGSPGAGAADCGLPCVPLFSITTSISVSSSARILFTIFFPGIVDIQVHVVLRSFDGKAAVVGSGIVHGTCEEHDCGACEWLAVGVQYVSFYDTVLGYSDVIVTDFAPSPL